MTLIDRPTDETGAPRQKAAENVLAQLSDIQDALAAIEFKIELYSESTALCGADAPAAPTPQRHRADPAR